MFSAAPVTGRKANSRLPCSRDRRNGIFSTFGWTLWLADDLGASCVSNTAARRSFLANAGLEAQSKPLVCALQQALLVASVVFRLGATARWSAESAVVEIFPQTSLREFSEKTVTDRRANSD